MADVYYYIESALYARIGSLSGNPPMAMPKQGYTPTEGSTYLRVHIPMYTTPQAIEIGYGAPKRREGIFQIDVVTPKMKAWNIETGWADDIIEHFPPGLKLTSGVYTIHISMSHKGPCLELDESWNKCVVDIDFWCNA